MNGRAVSIAFYGDQSAPGQELSDDDDNFISFFDKDSKSELFYSEVMNEYGLDPTAPRPESYDFYAKGIVNPGESFVGTSLDDPEAWTDWSGIAFASRKRR